MDSTWGMNYFSALGSYTDYVTLRKERGVAEGMFFWPNAALREGGVAKSAKNRVT